MGCPALGGVRGVAFREGGRRREEGRAGVSRSGGGWGECEKACGPAGGQVAVFGTRARVGQGATACRHRRGGGQIPGALRKVSLPLFALEVCEHDQRAQYGNPLKVLA